MTARSPGLRATVLVLWLALAFVPLRLACAAEKLRFDIPAGRAEQTLQKFATYVSKKQHIGVLFGTDDVRGLSTKALHGEFSIEGALDVMLRGTGIRHEYTNKDTITLTPPAKLRIDALTHLPLIIVNTSLEDAAEARELGSHPTILTREDFYTFGLDTMQKAMRTLPQVFGGGPTEDTHIGVEARTNAAVGYGLNLRGLGAGSTLVLLDGRRLPFSGSEGRFTDVAGVPLAAVKSIEMLPDTSSSAYGADAVGGLVNIHLLDSFDGAQTDTSFSAATHGNFNKKTVSQLLGGRIGGIDGLLTLDFQERDALRASDRARARSDLRRFGGDDFDSPQSNPATITQGYAVFAVPRGQDGTRLTPDMLIAGQQNRENIYEGADLLPGQQRWSIFGRGTKKLNDSLKVFAEGLFSQRDIRSISGALRTTFVVPPSNAFYVKPIAESEDPVRVDYDLSDDLGRLMSAVSARMTNFALGAETRLENGTQIKLTTDITSERLDSVNHNTLNNDEFARALIDPDPATAFNPFGEGSNTAATTLAKLSGDTVLTTNSQIRAANLSVSRAFDSSLGRWELSGGGDYRWQTFESDLRTPGSLASLTYDTQREIAAGFASLTIPLRPGRTSGGPNALEISLARRHEHYSDFGSVVTPRYGLSWAPLDALRLRGTFSHSFRPPSLIDLDEKFNVVALLPATDSAGNPTGLLLYRAGNNSQLREERARSWTLGIDLDVPRVRGLSAALTYFHTRFIDRVNVPVVTSDALMQPALAALITRNPTVEERQRVCNAGTFLGVSDFCMAVPIDGIIDARVRNSALTLTDGIDIAAEYVHPAAADLGTLSVKLAGTYITSFVEAASPLSPRLERVSTQYYPTDLRLRGTVEWRRAGLGASALVTYFDGYRDIATHRRVKAWTTLDVNLSYAFNGQSAAAGAGSSLSLAVENILNTNPPFLNNVVGIGYDQENGELTGRIVSLSLRQVW